MKSRTHFKPMMALAAMVWCGQMAPVLSAQDPAPAPASQTPAPAPASQTAPVQLSVGVWDVLRLAHANVSDGIITAYIKNSGKVYALGASEILYLREQGLSDQVVTAMLDQRKNGAATTGQAAPQPITPAAQPSAQASSSPQNVPAATQPVPTYVQAAPVYQPSPVYVYPPSYYSSWPYYGSYWGYPALSFSFGWGGYGGYHGGGYHGGHYGGGYHGGGYHGGGYHGGGHSGGGGHRWQPDGEFLDREFWDAVERGPPQKRLRKSAGALRAHAFSLAYIRQFKLRKTPNARKEKELNRKVRAPLGWIRLFLQAVLFSRISRFQLLFSGSARQCAFCPERSLPCCSARPAH
jgi:uncharacterized membrane protein YgcG